jgi:hypothetical protein
MPENERDEINHATLLKMREKLKRPLYTLEVLGKDPFTAGQPARLAGAKWFAKLWKQLDVRPGAHLHRIHYVIVSQAKPVLMPNGEPYENTRACEGVLERTSLDARYLDLIPAGHLVDRRNEEAIINLSNDESDALITTTGDLSDEYKLPQFDPPRLSLLSPTVLQRYHLEIWIEKTTMDDVLLPLAERYGINPVRGAGEMSETRCLQLVDRAEESGRPVRILYISDFDPAGNSMPVAVARKIEFVLRKTGSDADIQVRPIVLTHKQCLKYRLPRTPLKDTEKRAARFEERFGEGATELDALEALHPGTLEKILEQEIDRYYDNNLGGRIDDTASEAQDDLDNINTEVLERHADEIAALKVEHKKVVAAIAAFKKKATAVQNKIERDLEDEAPDADDYSWPEPDDGDEDDDPLFDSTRDYVEQIDRYKRHQGKPIVSTRKPYEFSKVTCVICGETFDATSRNKSMAHPGACLEQLRRNEAAAAKPLAKCVVCGKSFKSIRGAKACSKPECRNEMRRRKRGSE